jgi:60 kDa SS-A/Ro ribonucleoprotein
VVEISEAGRAPKNDPALLVLAKASASQDAATRAAALEALPRVARIPTHLFHFVQYALAFRRWGRGLRRAVARWYQSHDDLGLAYQMTKYQSRDGWSHQDLIRLAHVKPATEAQQVLFQRALGKEVAA